MWFDLLLIAVSVWGMVAGGLLGVKAAVTRILVIAVALFISLPFAANCAPYLPPIFAERFATALEEKVIAVSTGQSAGLTLGPWQDIVMSVPASTTALPELILLALNITGLVFLILVICGSFRLLERSRIKTVPSWAGACAGFVGGLLTVLLILALAPVLALGERGVLLTIAIEESMVARLLKPLVQGLVHFVAPYVLFGGGCHL